MEQSASGMQEALTDDLLLAERGDVLFGQPDFGQDLVVVLAQCRRHRTVVPPRTWCDPERPTGEAVASGDRMLELLVEAARIELLYVVHAVRGQQSLSRHSAAVEFIGDLVGRECPGPFPENGVECVVVVPPVLNSGGGITYFDKWKRLGMDFIWLSVADNQVKTRKI